MLTPAENSEWEELEDDLRDVEQRIEYLQANVGKPRREPVKPNPGGVMSASEKREYENAIQTGRRTYPMKSNGKDAEFRYDPNKRDGSQHSMNRYMLDGPPALEVSEYRALQGDSDVHGGYLTMPVNMSKELIRAKENLVTMRKLGKLIQLDSAVSLGVATLDSEIADPTWTAEIRTGTEDSSMSFGKPDLSPHPLAKRIKVSETLLRTAAAETVVSDSMVNKFAIIEENCFLNGTGENQPLGAAFGTSA